MERTQLSQTVKDLRKEYGLTQEELAMKSGVGLNFVHQLEQGKPMLRMDKVNQLLELGHEERSSGGAYIMQKNDEVIETYVISDGSEIMFLTNVAYIQQNFDKEPSDKSANAYLIKDCISMKEKHKTVSVKIIPFHKFT